MKHKKNTLKRCLAEALFGALFLFFFTGCSDRAYTLEELAKQDSLEVVEPARDPEKAGEAEESEDPAPEQICVFVCGQVAEPGLVCLDAGSRAGDALELAGGLTESGDPSYVNLAEVLEDGQKLYFPSVAEVSAQASSGESSGININTADAAGLCQLPGIGASKAAAILDHRTKYGRFETPEDLMQVSGIGQASFERLRPYIRVN